MGAPKGTRPWNTGTGKGWVDRRGYRWLYVTENGRKRARREHRVLMERHLGRRIEPWELVHHINGDTADNRIENLEIQDWGKHTADHHKGTRRDRDAKRSYEAFALLREELKHTRKINMELLEALEELTRFHYLGYSNTKTLEMIVSQARTAIAKAKGA